MSEDIPELCEVLLQQWEREYRASAYADGMAILSDQLLRLGLPVKPCLLLEGTITVVAMCAAYATMDGRRQGLLADFLAMQAYDPKGSIGAEYAYTFDIGGQASARICVNTKENLLDLADLYEVPFWDYKVCGYRSFWVSHLDWSPITAQECTELEASITNDLRFDYSEDELDFSFEDGADENFLHVTLYEFDATEMDD